MPRNGISQQIENLHGQDIAALRDKWTALYGIESSIHISHELLIQAVAYRLQEQALGGLKQSVRRTLSRLIAEFHSTGSIAVAPASGIKPGTKLIREWRGKVHEIGVLADGFTWSGRRYRTLSEIARTITGTRWSGPRFFGLEAGKSASITEPASVDG